MSHPPTPIDQNGPDEQGIAAIVVGVLVAGEDPDELSEDLSELKSLLSTLGIETRGEVVQRRQRLSAKYLLGKGKAEEVADFARNSDAGLIVVDRLLSPPQVRNLEDLTGCEVTDRTGVILDIFARHARTNAAKAQVELAKLEYLMPRMTGAWTHFQRQRGGGVRARGMGETQIEVDRRRARERMARLRSQLASIRQERLNQRKGRSNELKVSLVGYTNSGKTSLMNAMTRANLEAADVLFATLDTNVRSLDPTTRPKILLSDTVGFIRSLPHSLVESFKSTLEEVLEADLLLHVVDTSHPNYRAQMQITEEVLSEIGASAIPTVLVFNKMDQVDDPHLAKILPAAHRQSICVSAVREEDVHRLRKHVFSFFEQTLVETTLALDPQQTGAMSLIYKHCIIIDSDFSERGVARFHVRVAPSILARLQEFVIRGNTESEHS